MGMWRRHGEKSVVAVVDELELYFTVGILVQGVSAKSAIIVTEDAGTYRCAVGSAVRR